MAEADAAEHRLAARPALRRVGAGPAARGARWSSRARGMFGSGTSYQILRYDDAETVLRDADTFSSSINAEHIGQFMGDLILAMNGPEHRTYRNLVAKAFRASQLERWDETLVRPDDRPPARRDRAARARRSRRVGHVGVPGAGDLRHRGRAARRRRAVRARGPSRSTWVRSRPRRAWPRRRRWSTTCGRSWRRGAPNPPATSSPTSCTKRSTASSSPTRRSTASCGCCCRPARRRRSA